MPAMQTGAPETGTATEAAPRQTLAMRLAERNRQRALRAERLAKLRTLGPDTEAAAIAEPVLEEIAPEAVPDLIPDLIPAASAPLPAGMAEDAAAPVPTPGIVAEVTPETTVETTAEITAEITTAAIPEPAPEPGLEAALPAAPMAEVLTGPGPARDRDADAALADFLRALTGGVPPAPAPLPAEPGAILHFQRPADRPDPETAATLAASGLEQLPGAGPGLVWALGRAGLDSLAAIAPLAPAELAERLGPIGRLVPAERWVATARAAVPDAIPDSIPGAAPV